MQYGRLVEQDGTRPVQYGGFEQDTAYVETIAGTTVSFVMVPVPGTADPIEADSAGGTLAPFWISKTEITWDLYDVFVFGLDASAGGADVVSRPTRPYVLPGEEFGHEGRPAIGVSFHAATEFTRWLSHRTGRRYRLATEAEWEHTCRLGRKRIEADSGIWHRANSNDRTHPVNASSPDALGVHDMLGNVAEWVQAEGEPVVKGGAFTDRLDTIDCSVRRKQTPAWNATDPQLPKSRWWLPDAVFVGFRVIRER
ncbi:MAG: formylglycine-generating enzyme family protein [Longimicrobiales bacterium]